MRRARDGGLFQELSWPVGATPRFLMFAAMLAATAALVTPSLAVADTWFPAQPMSVPRVNQATAVLNNGEVLVAGGYNGFSGGSGSTTSLRSTEIFDPSGDRWRPVSNLTMPRAHPYATLLPSGDVLLIGEDRGGEGAGEVAEVYDPPSNSWKALASRPELEEIETVTRLSSGKILVTGTFGPHEYGAVVGATIYDPATNAWTSAVAPAQTRLFATATLLPNGNVLVLGGIHYGEHWSTELHDALASAEEYDPMANTWTPVTPMHQARWGHTATLVPGGEVLVIGGSEETGIGEVNAEGLRSAEIYDPLTEVWSPIAAPAVGRHNHTASLLPAGQVLVVGGWGDFELSPAERMSSPCFLAGCEAGFSAEIYDPTTHAWTPTSAVTGGANHAATLLPGEGVLVSGGMLEPVRERDQSSAEIFASRYPPDEPSISARHHKRPVIRRVSESRRRWREASGHSRSDARSVGTTFSFFLSEPASVSFHFFRLIAHPVCARLERFHRSGARCKRRVTAGTLKTAAASGHNKLVFRGQVSPSNVLGPGRYAVVLEAADADGQQSKPRELRFTILPP